MDMDIYDVADHVGAPVKLSPKSSSFTVFYHTKEGNMMLVGFTIVSNQALFEESMHVIVPD